MATCFSLSGEEQDPEPQRKRQKKSSQRSNDKNTELLSDGAEHVSEDADVLFVRVVSSSKPVVSNILNRVTPGSKFKGKKGRVTHPASVSQPAVHVTPVAKAMPIPPSAQSECRPTDNPIPFESSCKPHKTSSPQVAPPNLFPPARAALSIGHSKGNPQESKQLYSSDSNRINSKRSKIKDEITSAHSSSAACSTVSPMMDTDAPPEGVCFVSKSVGIAASFPWTYTEKVPLALRDPDSVSSSETLVKPDLSSATSQNRTFDPEKGTLTLLLSDFYYGQHEGDGQSEQKTYTRFKCLSCLKVLKNVRFMNHMKHHLEAEKQKGDSWENHTICKHCQRQFPTPFQMQCHVDSVHTAPKPAAICKICELSFETDMVLLQHMKDSHKPGEMPYVCQVCNYRSSAFVDVEMHFRTCHESTNNLLCLFCLKIFKTANAYKNHFLKHWRKKTVFPCSKCRLQFLSSKDEVEHTTKNHQTFKMPECLEGLPSETKIVIQTSVHPSGDISSITVNNADHCLSPVKN